MQYELTEIIQKISEIIKFDSSQSTPESGAPFGKGARASLDYFLNLAKSFGFETHDYRGYAGEVFFGEGKEFAVLAHLDVVPAGGGWTHEPFGGEIDCENKKIWGRGAMDDKGPAIIALYALKALKESGFIPKRKIKLIVGCNEENGWECIEYYKKHAHMPEEGISPDADFPVIFAEKGILQIKITYPVKDDFSSLKGGDRANMVCGYCEIQRPENKEKLKTFGLTFKDGKIISKGKSAHGSTPELGKNAIAPILQYLGLNELYNSLFVEFFGFKDVNDTRDDSGVLTFSPNLISGGKDYIEVIFDVRYPVTFDAAKITEGISAQNLRYEILHAQSPLYNDKNSFLIKTLCNVYNEVTGKNAEPVAIGGGTYARALKYGAAFGPEEAGEENTIHQANEYITFEKIEKCYKIYTLALKRLTE